MYYRIPVIVLALGAIAGFASAAHHMHERHDAFERHVAEVCTDAALRAAARPR